jgi:hypothetical protein
MFISNLKQSLLFQIIVIYTRYLIGGAFVFASIVKIKGERFLTDMNIIEGSPIFSAAHMFETLYQSGLYWKFIGLSQLVAAFLLMTQRFSKLGALTFFPIILNIFFITVSYDFGGTTYITTLMLMANVALLLWDWDELKVLLNFPSAAAPPANSFEKMKIWEVCGLILFAFTAIWRNYVVSFTSLLIWIVGCALIGLISLIVGIRHNNKRKQGILGSTGTE